MTQTDVLVVGAGPTGLVLALGLSRLGVKVRVIDKAARAATSTRAIVVQARTLELYDQLDPVLTDHVCERAHPVGALNVWVRGSRAFRLPIADVGRGLTPRSPAQTISQHEHEKVLADQLLARHGVAVELQTELLDFDQEADDAHDGEETGGGTVTAHVRTGDGAETITARYIAGCDGSHSIVRKKLGIAFPGGTYDRLFYVADIDGGGPVMDGEVHICLDKSDFLGVFPLAGQHRGRLLGTIEIDKLHEQAPLEAGAQPRDLTFDDVGDEAIKRMGLQVDQVNWFSSYRLHHRVAESFGRGRAFLLGDAAHVHSPIGGQGMNTGIGDAVNLAWKLAAVIRADAQESLLATYEEERRRFAEKLVSSTDGLFTMMTSKGRLARLIRTRLLPLLFSAVFSSRAVKTFVLATGSQLTLNYRDMALTSGRAPRGVQPGERLPWVKTDEGDGKGNFALLSPPRWRIHVYGEAGDALVSWCEEHDMPLAVYPFGGACKSAGLVRDALYLLRPDAHVALVERRARPGVVERYFAERQMRLCRG
ncbi:hypothetical protein E4U41_002111 [Claviceps citrina]|nr:hypothetical protein E4U41_002111 [Claviceps citrina]